MTKQLETILKDYDYRLPPELIANRPASPRDSAKLLVYNRKSRQAKFGTFRQLGAHLPKNAVLVFNQTKVWPARLVAKKTTGGPFDQTQGRPEQSRGGGKVELLYIGHDKKLIKTLANRPLAKGAVVTLARSKGKAPQLKVAEHSGQFYFFEPSFVMDRLPQILKSCGITPLPPYIKNSPLSEAQKREQYQAVFAKTGLSVAAPTASLHFTKKLINNLKKQGIAAKFVRLDVGLGTFAPLKQDNINSGKLHQEYYSIDRATAAFLNLAKQQGRPIIAVGTTVARTLESAAVNGRITKLSGNTELFIQESYKFRFIDGLVTNFHVPKSSLLMLVSAFAGKNAILHLYRQAIANNFRFFSFGDGMLIT